MTKAAQIKHLSIENTRLNGLVSELSDTVRYVRTTNMNSDRVSRDLKAALDDANKKLTSAYSALGEQQVLVKTLVAVINDLRAIVKETNAKAAVDRNEKNERES